MTVEMPITEARHRLTMLPRKLEHDHDTVAVTVRGKPVLAVLPWDLYESIVETLEIMGDPELLASLRQSIREAKAGKLASWDFVKKRLSL